MDDILFEEEGTTDNMIDDWVSMDFDIPEETKEEEKVEEIIEDEKAEEVPEEKMEDTPEVPEEAAPEKTTEELDLDALFEWLDSELETSNDALDKLEEAKPWEDTMEIWLVRDSLKRMEDQVKKLSNNNADLKFRNAELEAFGINDDNPQLLIVSRNMKKAMDWDDKSKNKVVTTLKEMLYNLTWEDFDETKIDKDIDLLTASEAYNTEVNPNLNKNEKDDFDWIAL